VPPWPEETLCKHSAPPTTRPVAIKSFFMVIYGAKEDLER
jgi:hypothetical protein